MFVYGILSKICCGFRPFLLEFYVTCHCGCYQNLLLVRDYDRKDKQTSPAPDNPGPGRQAARVCGTQVMNRQIGGGNAFVDLHLSEDREGSRGIDQRSNRATVNDALILFQLVADFQVNADCARADLAKLET